MKRLFWCGHDHESVRLWREDWAHDQFIVLSKLEFAVFTRIQNMLGTEVLLQEE